VSPDPFAPWREAPEVLRARTVGREDVLNWLLTAGEAALAGKRPLSCLLVGERGAGKSHLLALAHATLSRRGVVRWVGEQTPLSANAEALWTRIWQPPDVWAWSDTPASVPPKLLFIDGFDRLLDALGPKGRWAFRHHLQESGAWVAGTAYSAALGADSEEAFFGQLDTWALQPLSEDEAELLFARVSQEEQAQEPARLGTRRALLPLAAGNPRVLTVLACAARGQPLERTDADDVLLKAVQVMAPAYQHQFAALPPLGQQICEALALAPRALLAGEVQRQIGAGSATVSTAARGLEAEGILSRKPEEQDARASRYMLREPLFRAWLESSRCVGDEQARVVAAVGLLGDVLLLSPPPPPREPGGDEPGMLSLGSTSEHERSEVQRLELERALERSLERLERAMEEGEPRAAGVPPEEPQLVPGRLEVDSAELPPLLLAAHQLANGVLFERIARAMCESRCPLPLCPRPQRPAPAADALAPLMSRAQGTALTWAASLAIMSEPCVGALIEVLAAAAPSSRPQASAEIVALLALSTAASARAERLLAVLGSHPSAASARRMWRQLQAREQGPLHVELEQLWRALASGSA
jgi:DNA-binding MarR family transcriptional regulator